MNNKKPDSLYQSMEKWIELYRNINTCSHDQAHDAFEAWAEKLRGESSDQTTTLFHEAVKASFEEMLKGVLQASSEDGWIERTLNKAKCSLDRVVGIDDDIVIEFNTKIQDPIDVALNPQVGEQYGNGLGTISHDDSVKANLLGLSSLLESPHESRSAERSLLPTTNIREQWKNTTWSQPGQRQGGPLLELSYGRQPPRRPFGKAEFGGPVSIDVPDNAPIGGPLLDTGKDPLSFNDLEEAVDELTKKIEDGHQIGASYTFPPSVTASKVRASLEKVKADAEEALSKVTEKTHPSKVSYAQGILDMVTCRLVMLDEMELREQEQQGRGNMRGKMTTEETRLHVEKIINEQERRLASLTDELEINLVEHNIKSARRRLRLLDEVEVREKERKGILSLPRKQ